VSAATLAPVLRIENLNVTFDAAPQAAAARPIVRSLDTGMPTGNIVKDLSLHIDAGEILGLVGASGSGKSMTARAILQLLPRGARMSGGVWLRGEALSGMSAGQIRSVRGRDVGMIFQEPMASLNPLMCIGDQVAETVLLHRKVARREARAAARVALDQAGLPGEAGALERLPFELSGGQRQRVAIAMAIVMAPALLIADEPTTALDVITQAQVLTLLRELAKVRGMSLLLVSHDLAVIAQLADRVAVMQHGAIVEQGDTAQILQHGRHPYTQALLAAARLRPKRAVLPRLCAAPPAPPAAPARSATSAVDAATVLEVKDVVLEYPRRRRSLFEAAAPLRALDGVSLSIRAGETVGLVGESGSGKTSLLQVILALRPSTRGRVNLLGNAFCAAAAGKRMRQQRRCIQAVFQDPVGSFDPRWTVERLVTEPFFLLDAPPSAAERRRRVAEVLEQVGMDASDARRYPHEFSGGQRQRIAIARALVTQPAVIALDEAVSALDVLVRDQILQLLAQLAERVKVASLFVTHDLHVIRAIADRVYVMQSGRIVEEGATESLFNAPQHPYTRALIEATPVLPT
jgi:peptide/nickel transport system ATP-binding protein